MNQNQPKKILILDDEPDSISLLKLRLENKGHAVYSGMDGLEGLTKLRKNIPDLIIMDAVMPKLDGVEFFKTIRKDERYHMTPVLVLTGKPDYRETFTKMGCDYFATKPFDAAEIALVAERLMREKVLVVGDYKDFQEHIRAEFPENKYQLDFVDEVEQMLQIISQKRFHMAVVRLAQVRSSPGQFMDRIHQSSLNRNLKIFAYCDAYVPGTETGDEVSIGKLEVEWVKAGDVIFYDLRIHGRSIVEFLAGDD